jgi:hypothetical protein
MVATAGARRGENRLPPRRTRRWTRLRLPADTKVAYRVSKVATSVSGVPWRAKLYVTR